MTTDPTTYSQIQVPSPQSTSAQPTSISRCQEYERTERSEKTHLLSNNNQTAPLSSSVQGNNINSGSNSISTAQNIPAKMMLTFAPQYSHNIAPPKSQPASNSSSARKDDILAPRDLDLSAIANTPLPASSPLTLPKPPTSRLPVRMGLSDPRVHNYLSPNKSVALPPHGPSTTSIATATTPLSTMSCQDQTPMRSDQQSKPSQAAAVVVASGTGMCRSTETSQLRSHPYRAQQLNTAPSPLRSSIRASIDPAGRRTSEDRRPRPRGTHQHVHPNGIDRYHSVESHIASRIHSSSPRHLPSPSPSVPSSSPESMLMAPETVWVGHGKSHWTFDPTNPHTMYQLQYEDQQERMRQKARPEMSSPPSSEGDLYLDSRTLPPLFPPYSAGSQSVQSTQAPPADAPPAPPATQAPPLPTTTAALGSVNMTTSLSMSSNTSSSSSTASLNSFNPLTDSRAISPPLLNIVLSSKHHHPRIPIRSPERDGHELMMTSSTVDTNSSAYLNMDYYNIYRQNPLLLRPEGGRYDDRRPQASHVGEDSSNQNGIAKQKAKSKVQTSDTTNKGTSGSDGVKTPRKHSISLQSTGTHRVLRNEVAHTSGERDLSHDIVSGLGIQSTTGKRRSYSEGSSTPRASSRMSISHLLTSDDDSSYHSFRNGSGSKRKLDHSNETVGEPPKRKRMSRKRAAELGLVDEHGNVLQGRKRSKKVHNPDQLSPAGFRHGGERMVQEPDEPIVLESGVGPIDILNRISRPTVVWKGHPLPVVGRPGYELLHPYEAQIASTLRLSPAQYLGCKRTLILASRDYQTRRDGKQFRKSDAQKLCRIDVNKTSRLWEVFAKVGWLEGISEKDI